LGRVWLVLHPLLPPLPPLRFLPLRECLRCRLRRLLALVAVRVDILIGFLVLVLVLALVVVVIRVLGRVWLVLHPLLPPLPPLRFLPLREFLRYHFRRLLAFVAVHVDVLTGVLVVGLVLDLGRALGFLQQLLHFLPPPHVRRGCLIVAVACTFDVGIPLHPSLALRALRMREGLCQLCRS